MWRYRRFRQLLIAAFLAGTVPSAAVFAAPPDRPVVFVPGILGSRLCQGQDILWGNIFSLNNFGKLQISLDRPRPEITSCGLVEKIALLGPFWAVHQYDDVIATLRKLGYRDGKTLFVFAYDWRLSNFETAKSLQSFIDGTVELRSGKFDLVAHSMGGIVSRIYLQQFNGTAKVRKVIYLGTPFAGSMNALATLSNGWGTFANRVAGGLDTIRRTILSFPAFYELFPRYDNCCRIGSESGFQSIDILNYEIWQRYNWLPAE